MKTKVRSGHNPRLARRPAPRTQEGCHCPGSQPKEIMLEAAQTWLKAKRKSYAVRASV
jgi:hypothetical protein